MVEAGFKSQISCQCKEVLLLCYSNTTIERVYVFLLYFFCQDALVHKKVCTPTWFCCDLDFIYICMVYSLLIELVYLLHIFTQCNFGDGLLEIIAFLCFFWQLCSVGLVTGLLICLRSAAKITHKAQAITKHAAKWHVCATIESFTADPETPSEGVTSNCVFPVDNGENEEYNDHEADDEDEYEATKLVAPPANTITFQKRQALGETLIKSS